MLSVLTDHFGQEPKEKMPSERNPNISMWVGFTASSPQKKKGSLNMLLEEEKGFMGS